MTDRFNNTPLEPTQARWSVWNDKAGVVSTPQVKHMDILDVTKGCIVHQINPIAMGAGLALLIRKRYPQVYIDFLDYKSRGRLNLGIVVWTTIDKNLSIASYVGQLTYGRGGVHTQIGAVDDALYTIETHCSVKKIAPIYLPWKMGCGLAGGDWDEIAPIIGNRVPNSIICKLGAD